MDPMVIQNGSPTHFRVPPMRPGDRIVAYKSLNPSSTYAVKQILHQMEEEQRGLTGPETTRMAKHVDAGILVGRSDDTLLIESPNGRKHIALDRLLAVQPRI